MPPGATGTSAMAIRAANFTLRDLAREGSDRMLLEHQLHDTLALTSDVIELEHDEVVFPTVGATGLFEYSEEVFEVAPPKVAGFVGDPTLRGKPPRLSPSSSSAPMTIDADQLALGDLSLNARQRVPVRHKSSHIRSLGPHVIELEDNRVPGSTVFAGTAANQVEYVSPGLDTAQQPRGVHLPRVQLPSLANVCAPAVLAPGLALMKARDRKRAATAAAAHSRFVGGGGRWRGPWLWGFLADVDRPQLRRAQRHVQLGRNSAKWPPLPAEFARGSLLCTLRSHTNVCS